MKAGYAYKKGNKQYGDVLRITFNNKSRIYVATKKGIIITMPKRLAKKQWADKKRKNLEIIISIAELKILLKAMKKTIGLNEQS